MRFLRRGVHSLLLALLPACGLILSVAVAVQSQQASPSSPSPALNEQQTTGRKLYNQNCRLCHTPEAERAKDPTEGKSVGPSLVGVFRPPRSRPDVVVRTFIQQGIADKMPGFRYGLQPAEIDAIIAYLKTL